VLRGDARALPLPAASVDLIVTSPPYWSQRAYTDNGDVYVGQIGDEPTPAGYIDALADCTREWARVLKPAGSLWVNLGDKYGRGTRTTVHGSNSKTAYVSGGAQMRVVASGTTALMAATLGRTGITVDRSAGYCRTAVWRTTDRRELAKALRVARPPVETAGQLDLLAGVL
jgi:DNA modification methylase